MIQVLSAKQKDIYNKINSTNKSEDRKKLQKERNQTLTELHKEIAMHKEDKIKNTIKPLEDTKNDSNRIYRAVRDLQRLKKKTPLVIKTNDGITTDEDQQLGIITSFFKEMFQSSQSQKIKDIPAVPMTIPFTEEEISGAVKSLKTNKSPGIDDIRAEHLKSGPKIVNENIA